MDVYFEGFVSSFYYTIFIKYVSFVTHILLCFKYVIKNSIVKQNKTPQ